MANANAAEAGRRRTLARLALARADLTEALSLCDYALADPPIEDEPRYWALHEAVVITYGRPFTSNKPVGALAAKWHRFGDPRLDFNHKRILDLRNEVVAHAELKHRRIHVVPKGTLIGDTGAIAPERLITVLRVGLGVGSYAAVRELCADLLPRLNDAITEAFAALYGNGQPDRPLELIPTEGGWVTIEITQP